MSNRIFRKFLCETLLAPKRVNVILNEDEQLIEQQEQKSNDYAFLKKIKLILAQETVRVGYS